MRPGATTSSSAATSGVPVIRAPELSAAVRGVLELLWGAGHAAYVVGGAVRDELLGRGAHDWDVATDARPEELLALLPSSRYENRFGTVRAGDVEVTTFRRDHRYGDHRRPDEVTFTNDVGEDLARRDFTVNAIAWGRAGCSAASSQDGADGGWVDPFGGLRDIDARVIRAVGDPAVRFDEDALRLLRGARLAAILAFTIEPRTALAMREAAALVGHVSRERVGQEIRRMLTAAPPSTGFRILEQTGLLPHVLPQLAAQRGVPQNKIPGHDLWDHTLATLEAAAEISSADERLLLAALLHDVGKPETWAEGHFHGHDAAGARTARGVLARLAVGGSDVEYVTRLIAHHMFSYEPRWGDAAVRRFIRKVGADLVEPLFALRAADNAGSGLPAEAGGLEELRDRVRGELSRNVPLSLSALAVDGHDIQAELGAPPGPWLREILERLLQSVIADPERNTRELLLADARRWAPDFALRQDGRGEQRVTTGS